MPWRAAERRALPQAAHCRRPHAARPLQTAHAPAHSAPAPGNYKHLVTKERLLVCWFLCTGLIHLIVEGAVVLDSQFYKDTSKNILSEICECLMSRQGLAAGACRAGACRLCGCTRAQQRQLARGRRMRSSGATRPCGSRTAAAPLHPPPHTHTLHTHRQ